MIHYQLRCDAEHEFDGWFAGSAAFEEQVAHGQIACPHCASKLVERALMAPSVVTRKKPVASVPSAALSAAGPEAGSEAGPLTDLPAEQAGMPDVLRAKLQRLRTEIEQNCDYVGHDFAEEARRIHAGEIKARPIYGETSAEQAELLTEDGIPVTRIPWLPRADG